MEPHVSWISTARLSFATHGLHVLWCMWKWNVVNLSLLISVAAQKNHPFHSRHSAAGSSSKILLAEWSWSQISPSLPIDPWAFSFLKDHLPLDIPIMTTNNSGYWQLHGLIIDWYSQNDPIIKYDITTTNSQPWWLINHPVSTIHKPACVDYEPPVTTRLTISNRHHHLEPIMFKPLINTGTAH